MNKIKTLETIPVWLRWTKLLNKIIKNTKWEW